jgi:hypothetical protein
LLSPVLGTEALYRQAGWISPHVDDKGSANEVVDVVTTTDDDDDDAEENNLKPRRVLAVHETNQKYRSSQFSSHSLQMGEDDCDEPDVVDGMGSARAAHPQDLKEEAQLAQTNAANIRTAQKSHAMIGLISPTTDMDEDDDDEEEEDKEMVETSKNEEEFVIPRSMREIYRISNRNRRNKKSMSPLPSEPNEKEAQELAKAEELLKTRSLEGKNYFDEIPGTPKRQRTKSTGTASLSSEEAQGHDSGISREEDIGLMQDIGWIKGKEEVDIMLKQRHESNADGEEDEAASSEDEGVMKQPPPKPFDYSTIGPIGAFSATAPANPFFTGAATTGGHLNQQFGKSEPKKKQSNAGRGKPRRQQVERPERRGEGRAQTYKKR